MSAHGFRMLPSLDEARTAFDAGEHVEVTARENIDGRIEPDRVDMEPGESGWQREQNSAALDFSWAGLYYRARPANWSAPPVVEGRDQVDVAAVMDAAHAVIRSRIRTLNNKANSATKNGRDVHPDTLTKQDRAAYLADELAEARVAVVELVEATRELRHNIVHDDESEQTRGEFDAMLARADAALAKFGAAS